MLCLGQIDDFLANADRRHFGQQERVGLCSFNTWDSSKSRAIGLVTPWTGRDKQAASTARFLATVTVTHNGGLPGLLPPRIPGRDGHSRCGALILCLTAGEFRGLHCQHARPGGPRQELPLCLPGLFPTLETNIHHRHLWRHQRFSSVALAREVQQMRLARPIMPS